MLSQIAQLLVDTLFTFFVYLLLLRFHMQWLRVPFRNPIGQFVMALTDWIVKPARRVIPGLMGLDLPTLLIAWLTQTLALFLLLSLRGVAFSGPAGHGIEVPFILAAIELMRISLYLLIGVVLVQVIISWVNPHAPMAPLFAAFTRPFYALFRRIVPPIGGFDLSPVFVLLLAQILLIVLAWLAQVATQA